MKTSARITLDVARQALACLSPDVDRETWVRIAMAIKSEFGQAGFDVWNDWSAQGENYKPADAKAAWKSIKGAGKVTIGTLIGLAKERGFRMPAAGTAEQASARPARLNPAAEEEKRRKREAEEAEYRERADKAAADAALLWSEASEEGVAPYLQRKGVKAHGVRVSADGTLLVPMRDASGELRNVQRIAAKKPANDAPEKRFMPGGRKTGLFHLIGSIDGAETLLLGEGYATCATLHEASGLPVAVAFDAGNLVYVAKALAEMAPAAGLIVCGDDDRETEARTGTNPGRKKAEAAVKAARSRGARAAAIFPADLPEGGTDFNDLAAAKGLEEVRRQLEIALASVKGSGSAPASDEATGETQEAEERRGDPFTVDERGVWYAERDKDGEVKRPQWICATLNVIARTRGDDGNAWGVMLTFHDPDGAPKSWAMPSALLSGEGAEWAGRLRDMGLRIAPGTRARNLLAQYIDTRNPRERVTCTDRVGWHGATYVLPSGSIASETEQRDGRRYVFQTDSGMEDTFRRNGTLAEWRTSVAALAEGNSRFVFALAVAFSGPMLRLAGMESGGFHFRGDSSQGKTSALRVAASVYGRPSYLQRWRTTSNALEAIAAQHCDAALILDELGQLDPREAGEAAYLLSNEMEKGRSTRAQVLRRRRTWRLIFLSSGEISLAEHMAEAGKRTRAGMEVRMADVPLDAGRGMGGIEELHGRDGPATVADELVKSAARFYGTAGRTWLEWACDNVAILPERLQALIDRFRDDMVPEASAEQVRRVGSRFALVAAAGELATQAGITGWQAGHAAWAVRQCFNAWLESRGHLENGELAAMLRQVRRFLEAHGDGRFTYVHRSADDHAPKTLNRAGFRRLIDEEGKPVRSNSDYMREYGERMSSSDAERSCTEYIFLQECFRKEVCTGFDPDQVAKLLKARGHLHTETGRLTNKVRIPGMGLIRCYHVKPSIFDDEL